jgi:hypothetical protein
VIRAITPVLAHRLQIGLVMKIAGTVRLATRSFARVLTGTLCGISMLHAGAGCSSSSSGAEAAGDKYPAFAPDVGQLVNQGGPQLTSAKIVTVTWSADSNASTFEAFDDQLGGSSYWETTLKEYGIGPATGGAANHVRITASPMPTIDVLDLETWLGVQIGLAGTGGFPAYDPQALYVVWIPPAIKLTASGADACTGSLGTYHSEVTVGTHSVPYVFVDEACNGSQPLVDVATETGAHAIAETVTDPHLYTAPAVLGFDAPHVAWIAWAGPGAEVADVCVRFTDAYFKPASPPYPVQRLWSNAAAKAGHDPCGPATSDPYFNVAPQGLEMLSSVVIGTATKAVQGLGYHLPAGATGTFEVGYFSDAPTSAPIELTAVEGDGMTAPITKVLTLSVATGSGRNGDKDKVTVSVNPGSAAGNAFLMTLVTSVPGLPKHYAPVLVEAL